MTKTIERMTADQISLLIGDLLNTYEQINKFERAIPDGPTMGTKDALLSNAKVDLHNARWELSKAIQNLGLIDRDD
jgi:hypothetical protein